MDPITSRARGSVPLDSDQGDATSSPICRQYLHARVTVFYQMQQGIQDTGIVSFIDNNWVELTKNSGERLLMPLIAIRIIKMQKSARPESDAAILLRPAEDRPADEQRQIPK